MSFKLRCIARKPTCFELHSKTTANPLQTDSILLTNSKKTTNIEQNNIQMAGNVWAKLYIWYILIRLIARWAQRQTVELAISPTQCSIANMSNIWTFFRDRSLSWHLWDLMLEQKLNSTKICSEFFRTEIMSVIYLVVGLNFFQPSICNPLLHLFTP